MAVEQLDHSDVRDVQRDRLHFLLLNIGHFLDHLFTLVIATVAVTSLKVEWGTVLRSNPDLMQHQDFSPSDYSRCRPVGSPTSGAAKA